MPDPFVLAFSSFGKFFTCIAHDQKGIKWILCHTELDAVKMCFLKMVRKKQ